MIQLNVDFTILDDRARVPKQAHPGEDAGWDVWSIQEQHCPEDEWTYLRTGLIVVPAHGWWFEVVGRSSTPPNVAIGRGIIDNGYRGELTIPVMPLQGPITVPPGRHAQILFHQIPVIEWYRRTKDQLPVSERGQRGFGSSGRD